MVYRLLLARVVAVALLLQIPCGYAARAERPDTALSAVMQRLIDDPTTPEHYSAAVRLHVKLRIFPFISMTLRGESAYKRPGLYHFVFRGVPKAVEHFSDLAYDLGNPAAWPGRYTIELLTPPSAGVDPVVRLVPNKRGMVKSLDVAVDMAKGHINRATWNRFDGGVIALVQHYNSFAGHEIVAEQRATINIPHMRAELSADYSRFSL